MMNPISLDPTRPACGFPRRRDTPAHALLRLGLGLLVLVAFGAEVHAQVQNQAIHQRGRLWEEVWHDGLIGDLGAWDYGTSAPIGLFPGFQGFTHPVGGESNAIDVLVNATMHNFRSGVWIAARDLNIPGPPPSFSPTPADYEVFISGAQSDTYGRPSTLPPLELETNYLEAEGFNPNLPEEMVEATWDTNLGITVTRRSYVWGFPGASDFIIYDYTFENTGRIVSTLVGEVVPNTDAFQQTLEDVYFAFHSGISVSTKSRINFHTGLPAVQAGGFGWKPPFHDYYAVSDDNTLAYSYNYNGGAEPTPFDTYPLKPGQAWKQHFGDELMSPAAFGWLALSATSLDGSGPRSSPAPDVLRVDNHTDGTVLGQQIDLEFLSVGSQPKRTFYDFMTNATRQEHLGNDGDRFNFYTYSYGPYSLAPGESVRFVIAEIAGVMDYNEVIAGDPEGHFPDSTIAAIERNAELARNAVAWGFGATVDGMPLAADLPEPPPAPETDAVNASEGTEAAAIAVTWTDVAETTTLTDGSGAEFYDGSADLSGYRIYRSQDFQYTSDTRPPAFRGAAWTLIEDIPIAEAAQYFDTELGRYRFVDENVAFGQRYGYYVAGYNADPRPWTSANGTLVEALPELESGSYNRSNATAAVAGPVESFDVYVVPNPFVLGDSQRSFGDTGQLGPYTIEFRNLPERATIRIYTIAGDLIRTIEHGPDVRGNLFGTATWDQISDSGLLVAPGLYIYHVRSQTEGLSEDITGKLMIIR